MFWDTLVTKVHQKSQFNWLRGIRTQCSYAFAGNDVTLSTRNRNALATLRVVLLHWFKR